jgi:diadenosine tetraphosphatase ApaH/serine/threonine PP2A family protein phosphatase
MATVFAIIGLIIGATMGFAAFALAINGKSRTAYQAVAALSRGYTCCPPYGSSPAPSSWRTSPMGWCNERRGVPALSCSISRS